MPRGLPILLLLGVALIRAAWADGPSIRIQDDVQNVDNRIERLETRKLCENLDWLLTFSAISALFSKQSGLAPQLICHLLAISGVLFC